MKQETLVVPVPVPVPVPWFRTGTLGWVIIGTGVLVWDLIAPETLSAAFQRAHQHRASKVAVVTAWSILTLHLFRKLPAPVDPLHGLEVLRQHLINPHHISHMHDVECCTDPWDVIE